MEVCEFEDCRFCSTRQKSVFSALAEGELNELNESKAGYTFAKGEYVFHEGHFPRGLYCVHNGKLKIVKMNSDGKEQIVHLVKNGDIMGYRALLSGDKYSASGVALEESHLCFIPKPVFLGLVEKSNKLAMQVLHMFSVELRLTEKNMTGIALLPARQRVAQALLLLKESYGLNDDNSTINIAMSREEIANLAGTTRETAIRVLSDLNDEQVIELKTKKIKILKHKSLVEIAEIYD